MYQSSHYATIANTVKTHMTSHGLSPGQEYYVTLSSDNVHVDDVIHPRSQSFFFFFTQMQLIKGRGIFFGI